jgi:chloramphenicol 3-O phosphotransferase
MTKGKIIFLNGVSSSGKSSLAKELVHKLTGYFHMSVDDYDMIIEKMEVRGTDHLIPVPTEHFFHRSIAMFSDSGVNLIIDSILHDEFTIKDAFENLSEYPVLFVGVHCPEDELARRESARGDRRVGQAHFQLQFVHQQGEQYDVEVNTGLDTMEKCSEKIVDFLMTESPKGWKETATSILTANREAIKS